MDTFDSINLGVFVLIQLLLLARMTFWKRNGPLLGFWNSLPAILLCLFGCLDFLLWHHWAMPHRRRYQFILYSSVILVSVWRLVQRQLIERQKDKERQAQKAGRRYY